MKRYHVPGKFLLASVLIVVLAVSGAMAIAQSGSQDPEGGVTSPIETSPAPEIEAPQGEALLYKFIAGTSFHPRESTTTFAYAGAGCVNRTSTTGFLVADLQLPQDAEIDLIQLYFADTNADQDADLYLYVYDGLGGFQQLALAESSGSPGNASANSEAFTHTVDNATQALSLVAGTGAASDTSVRICGARVRYTIDMPSMMLPAILKDYAGG